MSSPRTPRLLRSIIHCQRCCCRSHSLWLRISGQHQDFRNLNFSNQNTKLRVQSQKIKKKKLLPTCFRETWIDIDRTFNYQIKIENRLFKRSYNPDPVFPGVPPMAPLISSIFLATLDAADFKLLKPTISSALRAFRFCGLDRHERHYAADRTQPFDT